MAQTYTDKKMSEGTVSIEKRFAETALYSGSKNDAMDASKKLEFIRDDSPVNKSLTNLQRIRDSAQTNSGLKRKTLYDKMEDDSISITKRR